MFVDKAGYSFPIEFRMSTDASCVRSIGNRQHFLFTSGSRINLAEHFIRNKVIGFTVNEQGRCNAFLNLLYRRSVSQVKVFSEKIYDVSTI